MYSVSCIVGGYCVDVYVGYMGGRCSVGNVSSSRMALLRIELMCGCGYAKQCKDCVRPSWNTMCGMLMPRTGHRNAAMVAVLSELYIGMCRVEVSSTGMVGGSCWWPNVVLRA